MSYYGAPYGQQPYSGYPVTALPGQIRPLSYQELRQLMRDVGAQGHAMSAAPAPGTAVPLAPGVMQGDATNMTARTAFQPPANMPNINFSAPIIRLGTSGPARDSGSSRKRDNVDSHSIRRGLGMDRGVDAHRQVALVEPTKEEMYRTIYIKDIPESYSDDELAVILRAVGSLRRWTRLSDADNKDRIVGFAEYEDAQSLENAAEVLKDVEVTIPKPESEESEKHSLDIRVDDESWNYALKWRKNRNEDEEAVQFRFDSAREELQRALTSLVHTHQGINGNADGDTMMQDTNQSQDPLTGEIVHIPIIEGEDELSEIPIEMRDTVAGEIASFRERSNKRDMERLRREEQIEAEQKKNSKTAKLASVTNGPAHGANGIPIGPRERGVQGAPIGPKGMQTQMTTTGFQAAPTVSIRFTKEEEESDADDETIWRRRQDKLNIEIEKQFHDHERRWLNRERNRSTALEREKGRNQNQEEVNAQSAKQAMTKELHDLAKEERANRKRGIRYHGPPESWLKSRAFRVAEMERDATDRALEQQELSQQRATSGQTMDIDYVAPPAEEMARQQEPQRVAISLGGLAQKSRTGPTRRIAVEVEGLLEDEDDAELNKKLAIKPLQIDTAAEVAVLTPEEKEQAIKQVAADIPLDKEALWDWEVNWEYITEELINVQMKNFVEKKVVETLGVQEEVMVDVALDHIRKKAHPEELVNQLAEVSTNILFLLFLLILLFTLNRHSKKMLRFS